VCGSVPDQERGRYALLLRFQSLFSFLGHESAILPSQERDRLAFTMLNLVHRALARVFVGTPAKKFCAVSKPAAGEMVVRDFHDNFGRDWFPLASPLGAPAAWPPPGAFPVNPGGFFNASNFFVIARRSEALNPEINPT